jgi:glucan phosphoethanolaminetransferase (alkaline phosphatase superfamily)
MKKILIFASLSEALTGLALLIVPAFVGKLLLGEELIGISIPIARAFGIALIALGVACWPSISALKGMITYSLLVSIYLTTVALEGEFVGKFLWPAIVLHIVLTILLIWSSLVKPESSIEQNKK